MRDKMENIVELIESLGGLHDGAVAMLQWLPDERRFELMIKDLYANFHGLPEYEGPAPAVFSFLDVSELLMDACLSVRGMLIDEWTIANSSGEGYRSELAFSPSGRMSIKCRIIERH